MISIAKMVIRLLDYFHRPRNQRELSSDIDTLTHWPNRNPGLQPELDSTIASTSTLEYSFDTFTVDTERQVTTEPSSLASALTMPRGFPFTAYQSLMADADRSATPSSTWRDADIDSEVADDNTQTERPPMMWTPPETERRVIRPPAAPTSDRNLHVTRQRNSRIPILRPTQTSPRFLRLAPGRAGERTGSRNPSAARAISVMLESVIAVLLLYSTRTIFTNSEENICHKEPYDGRNCRYPDTDPDFPTYYFDTETGKCQLNKYFSYCGLGGYGIRHGFVNAFERKSLCVKECHTSEFWEGDSFVEWMPLGRIYQDKYEDDRFHYYATLEQCSKLCLYDSECQSFEHQSFYDACILRNVSIGSFAAQKYTLEGRELTADAKCVGTRTYGRISLENLMDENLFENTAVGSFWTADKSVSSCIADLFTNYNGGVLLRTYGNIDVWQKCCDNCYFEPECDFFVYNIDESKCHIMRDTDGTVTKTYGTGFVPASDRYAKRFVSGRSWKRGPPDYNRPYLGKSPRGGGVRIGSFTYEEESQPIDCCKAQDTDVCRRHNGAYVRGREKLWKIEYGYPQIHALRFRTFRITENEPSGKTHLEALNEKCSKFLSGQKELMKNETATGYNYFAQYQRNIIFEYPEGNFFPFAFFVDLFLTLLLATPVPIFTPRDKFLIDECDQTNLTHFCPIIPSNKDNI